MIKYYIQQLKGTTSILEVEVRATTQMEDPSIAWALKPGEAMYRIVRPKALADSTGVPYMSFAFHDSEEEARKQVECSMRTVGMQRAERHGSPLTEDGVVEKLAAVKLVTL